MLDPKRMRDDLDGVARQLARRGLTLDTASLKVLENRRRELQTDVQSLQNARNQQAKKIGQARGQGLPLEDLLAEATAIGKKLSVAETEFDSVQIALQDQLARLPNIPHVSVPDGRSEADNQVIRTWGEIPQFDFTPKDHVELGAGLGMDFAAGAKLSGARFVVLRGVLAKLSRALVQYMLDMHVRSGYTEVSVPFLVKEDALFGTGQLPNLAEDLFAVGPDNRYYLIPTAEVPVTNLVSDLLLEAEQLPLKFVCYSHCFRSEAGSYGKDTRGMIRQHQFEKVELVHVVLPEHSHAVLEQLLSDAESVLQALELPYRVMSLCTADLGFSAAKTYDLEVWLPGQQCYREISSCSNMEDFQARRMKARYRDPATGKPQLVHTLNGSALAIGRTLVAILENGQEADGRIRLPVALRDYMGSAYL